MQGIPIINKNFSNKCDRTFTQESIDKIEGAKEWITELLLKK